MRRVAVQRLDRDVDDREVAEIQTGGQLEGLGARAQDAEWHHVDDLAGLDLVRLEARVGDRLMVCSDGLSDVVRPDRIRRLLADAATPAEAAAALRDEALAGPPTDNITVVVGDVREHRPDDATVMPCTVGAAVDFREETADALEALWPGRVAAGVAPQR